MNNIQKQSIFSVLWFFLKKWFNYFYLIIKTNIMISITSAGLITNALITSKLQNEIKESKNKINTLEQQLKENNKTISDLIKKPEKKEFSFIPFTRKVEPVIPNFKIHLGDGTSFEGKYLRTENNFKYYSTPLGDRKIDIEEIQLEEALK